MSSNYLGTLSQAECHEDLRVLADITRFHASCPYQKLCTH